MPGMWDHEPIVVAVALSLYHYNIDPDVKANDIISREGGKRCFDSGTEEQLTKLLVHAGPYATTILPWAWACAYVQAALDRYASEAQCRADLERRIYESSQ